MNLRIFDKRDSIKTLGPGTRYVVWTQGCNRKCKNCMSPESQDIKGGYLIDVQELSNIIVKSKSDGLTISGGEPFYQADALLELVKLIKKERDIGVIVYTGYKLEELEQSTDPHIKALLQMIDLIVDGPYIEELNDGKNLRGSSNQRAIPLTDRYAAEALEYGTKDAKVEFFAEEDKVYMVGVPSKEMLKRAKDIFASNS